MVGEREGDSMSRPSPSILTRSSLALVLILAAAPGFIARAGAQGVQTGELAGTVTSSDGQPLPGVTVSLVSPALQGVRTAATSPNGDYLFKHLPLGEYKVSFVLAGFASVEKHESMALGATVRANASLKVASMEERVTVVADSPSVIRDPQAGANIKAEEYDLLARNRDLEAVAELAPGLTQTAVNNDLAISGAFSYDNAYLLDGVDINDSAYSAPNDVYIEDAIEETQVLTSGITAEYGRFTGGAVNAVTKRGGNQFSGSFRLDFTNPSWTEETPYEKSQGITLKDATQKRYQATLGGPLVKDRLWFFLAGRLRDLEEPQVFDETGIAYTDKSNDKRLQVRLTGAITPNHTLNATYTKNDTTEDGGVNSCCTFIDPASINPQKFPLSLLGLSYNGVLRSNLFAEAQFSQQKTTIEFGGKSTDIHDSPFLGATLPGIYGAPYFDATDPSVRNNRQVTAALSYFLSTSKLGRHDIKGGFENFRTTDVGGNSQSATSYVFYTDYLLDDAGHPVVVDGSAQPVFTPFSTILLNWRATRGAKIDITTSSFYLNDRWTLNNKWSFNLGVRYERVRSLATGNIVSVDTDTIVPRLAATYDFRGDGKYTLQATYSHYAGRYGTSQFAGNTNVGNPTLIYSVYTGPEGTGKNFAPGFDTANYQLAGGFFPTANVFFAPHLSSPVNRELTVAAGMGFGPSSYAKLIFVNRKLTDFVEDFSTFDGGSTTVEENGEVLGTFTNTYFRNSNVPKRKYQALVLQTAYKLTSRWRFNGSWTLMLKNNGNFEGEGPGTPGISSGVGDFPEILVADRNFPEGRLNGYQRHKVRAWTTYDIEMGRAGRANIGLLWRFDSGGVYSLAAGNQPLSDIQLARDPGYASIPPSQTLFFGARGSEFFESASRFDLALNYDIPVYKKLRPWVKGEVRNMFNDRSLIAFNTTITPDGESPLDKDGLPTGFTRGSRFGQGTSKNDYPVARTFLVSIGFRF
jgi:outer membrane receptor protein involved in Fe transport